MRTFVFTATTALITGAFTATLLHFALPNARPAAVSAAVNTSTEVRVGGSIVKPTATPAVNAEPLSLGERMELAYTHIATPVTPALAASRSTQLLNEPVAILQPQGQGWEELPKGTAVQVLATKGAFSQVRYAQNTVTVPTSVLVTGANRTN